MQQTAQGRQYLQICRNQNGPKQVQVKWLGEEEEKVIISSGQTPLPIFHTHT